MHGNKDQMFFQHIVQEARMLGGTLDEVVPIMILVPLFFFIGFIYIGVILSLAWYLFIKKKKKGMGTKYLSAVGYWYFPFRFKSGALYKIPRLKTPPADRVHWI